MVLNCAIHTVGGGSAGAVVANRLSRNNKVLLIEAGGDPLSLQRVPGFAPYFLHNPNVDWMHRTVPQKHALFGHVDQVSLRSLDAKYRNTHNSKQ